MHLIPNASYKPNINSPEVSLDIVDHLVVDKAIVNELLLVCGVIGSTVDPTTQEIVPVIDCINWLQDLQRVLRRDEDAFRPISILIGKWKIVEQKLLPLVLSCRYDSVLVITIIKILVILTKPLSFYAMKAGKISINSKSNNNLIQEQIKLRDNAIKQANLLTEYKRLFVYHPSHLNARHIQSKESNKESQNIDEISKTKGLFSVFLSLLVEPLSRTGSERTDHDHLVIELVLHLFRNLLCAGEPLLKGGIHVSSEKIRESMLLHQKLISLLESELVFSILLVIGQEMESSENRQYNLLYMEIFYHVLNRQDPTLVARSALSSTDHTNIAAVVNIPENSYNYPRHQNQWEKISSSSHEINNNLRLNLKRERDKINSMSSLRHSRFGGTFVKESNIRKNCFVNATTNNELTSVMTKKRKIKKNLAFAGNGRTLVAYNRTDTIPSAIPYETGPASRAAHPVLHNFCVKFFEQCYGPVMKSIKNEFRRDSARLEQDDKNIFFRIVWFFCQWWRISRVCGKVGNERNITVGNNGEEEKSVVKYLIFTMDIFTFNLVLSAIDFYTQHRKYPELANVVSLYTEMLYLLYAMYNSKDSTEHIMALGLMDKLFYCQEAVDCLPKLLSNWKPATFTREYVCDLVQICHISLKLLDSNEKMCNVFSVTNSKNIGNNLKFKEFSDNPIGVVGRMNASAANFDVISYISRKVVSIDIIFMYIQLLSQYSMNATHINRQIVAFFTRLRLMVLKKEESIFKDKIVTYEPLLYNIHMLIVIAEIINDESLREVKSCELLSFSASFIRCYARFAEKNSLLHVEALFRQQNPRRFCELITHSYVSEDLRMMIEQDTFLSKECFKSNEGFQSKESYPDKILDRKDDLEAPYDNNTLVGNSDNHFQEKKCKLIENFKYNTGNLGSKKYNYEKSDRQSDIDSYSEDLEFANRFDTDSVRLQADSYKRENEKVGKYHDTTSNDRPLDENK